ncbi:DNA-binding transcriptional ArsR family regulator [Virgibacillus natechei]|uniref:DNA-binding transcriptional ArsR family regulator n=1 Tax=Virgibacillus natechei TaxID=1216297 RepID=A0ABS4IBT5_9BACI|nr:winged helix-turn-helix domain-containing protein [Virgibacillus natechei]MBP1968401.1 DNA-binding transcriptional ArsR family regulator [Virgibacillus natechei]UZD13526.1 winged helix-turn-helix domain-containing protein [Virgibacillus natechei]
MDKREMMEINLKQQKVISDPLRSQIIALLYEEPMTPKQTADKVGKNPGTIYYHIQQLFKHHILEIDHVSTEKGIVEKYYRAKAVSFRNPDEEVPSNHVGGSRSHMFLSDKLVKELDEEVQELFFKYAHLSYKETEEQKPYEVGFHIKEFKEEEGEE